MDVLLGCYSRTRLLRQHQTLTAPQITVEMYSVQYGPYSSCWSACSCPNLQRPVQTSLCIYLGSVL